ncbi:hypothetical protein Ddc_14376 [Ditylenchus destructor]|nr:hypothetical protein Ddc_14376 [Ditylenchus destructor]
MSVQSKLSHVRCGHHFIRKENCAIKKGHIRAETNQYRDFFAMCDFDCCDFGTCDFNTCDFDTCDFNTCDVGTCDFDTTNPIFSNLPLAALILNSEQKKKAKKKAERRNNMNTTSTDKPCECNNAHHRAYKVMVRKKFNTPINFRSPSAFLRSVFSYLHKFHAYRND